MGKLAYDLTQLNLLGFHVFKKVMMEVRLELVLALNCSILAHHIVLLSVMNDWVILLITINKCVHTTY